MYSLFSVFTFHCFCAVCCLFVMLVCWFLWHLLCSGKCVFFFFFYGICLGGFVLSPCKLYNFITHWEVHNTDLMGTSVMYCIVFVKFNSILLCFRNWVLIIVTKSSTQNIKFQEFIFFNYLGPTFMCYFRFGFFVFLAAFYFDFSKQLMSDVYSIYLWIL